MIARHRRIPLVAVLALVTSLAVAGCGSSSKSSSSSTPAAASGGSAAPATPAAGPAVSTATVGIANFKFGPAALVVKTGGRVTFTNHDTSPHTATADDGSTFDSGTLKQGQSKTVILTKPGTYSYHCQFHAFMTATITVR